MRSRSSQPTAASGSRSRRAPARALSTATPATGPPPGPRALTAGTFVLQHVQGTRQRDSEKIIEVVARQEMLSQRIALLGQALSGSLTPGQREAAGQRLDRAVTLMSQSDASLQSGDHAIT